MGAAVRHPSAGLTVLAPAKLNLSLEVLRRRPDGYHELCTLFQAIDLCDELTVEPADGLTLTVEGDAPPGEENLVLRAAHMLLPYAGGRGAHLRLRKRIPSGAGLGGGSSDAAAALLALDRLWRTGLEPPGLAEMARTLGADVPFFLHGGTALGTGRGDEIKPLPDVSSLWFVLSVPPFSLPEKTARVFRNLRADELTDGLRTLQLAAALRGGGSPGQGDLYNGLRSAALRAFSDLGPYLAALEGSTGRDWALSGAGPACYALAASRTEAEDMARCVENLPGVRYVTSAAPPGTMGVG